MGHLRPAGRAEEVPLVCFPESRDLHVYEVPDAQTIPTRAPDVVIEHVSPQGSLQILPPLLRHRDEEARAHLAEESKILASVTEFGLDLRLVELHPDPARERHLCQGDS